GFPARGAGPMSSMRPVSLSEVLGWSCFYVAFLIYAAMNTSGFLFLDYANLMFHEVGHPAFSWAGYYPMIMGGPLGELIGPLVCLIVFWRQGTTAAVAFCAFWAFENLLYIAAYMADARRSALPLVGSDESDWTILFTHWGVLQQDTAIAAV